MKTVPQAYQCPCTFQRLQAGGFSRTSLHSSSCHREAASASKTEREKKKKKKQWMGKRSFVGSISKWKNRDSVVGMWGCAWPAPEVPLCFVLWMEAALQWGVLHTVTRLSFPDLWKQKRSFFLVWNDSGVFAAARSQDWSSSRTYPDGFCALAEELGGFLSPTSATKGLCWCRPLCSSMVGSLKRVWATIYSR